MPPSTVPPFNTMLFDSVRAVAPAATLSVAVLLTVMVLPEASEPHEGTTIWPWATVIPPV